MSQRRPYRFDERLADLRATARPTPSHAERDRAFPAAMENKKPKYEIRGGFNFAQHVD
jgi:hypothetical protein